ncbi:MAG: hypothetical protein JXE07_09035 [Candidatus Aminicenantes bacterium]|nr:hypothetical protein [Candidatus Aminicenantes bacterium]
MSPASLRTALSSVIEVLENMKIPYYLGGSMASSAMGLPRTTLDVDIIADVQAFQAGRLADALQGSFYIDQDQIAAAIRRRSSFNIIHSETSLKVDIFIPKEREYDRTAMDRRRRESLSGEEDTISCYLASPEDIILSKLEWYKSGGLVSGRQWQDVQGVMKVQGRELDQTYLRKWALKLSISELLEKALIEAEIT